MLTCVVVSYNSASFLNYMIVFRYLIEQARDEASARKMFAKYYPDGIKDFDMDKFNRAFRREDELDEQRTAAVERLREARKAKNKAQTERCRAELKSIRAEKSALLKQLKEINNEYSRYNRAAKPYLDAKKLLVQQENYRHYEEIRDCYEDSKKRAEAARLEREEAARREKQEKEAYAAGLREQRRAAKNKKQ